MSGTYLLTQFRDKDQVKALGARWDPMRRQWYVPQGLDLTPFSAWLTSEVAERFGEGTTDLATVAQSPSVALTVPHKGVSLSQLLAGVSHAVASAYGAGVWTTVEVVDVRLRGGHVYLEVSERNPQGAVTAKAQAVIWASQALRVLPAFEQATGAQLGPGIKLLVHARPVFKPQYGFSLEIDAIDTDYTLGDLEARKRDIRERLQREGLFDLNRRLPTPWDYERVLVVAPEGGAGLGDFQAEAQRLERHGVCRFTYVYSRFQGEGAALEIRLALHAALEQIELNHGHRPDAVAIIRGGGAVNDLAWLNDHDLAKSLCELSVPVLTGIGHERDSTVLDEVANIRFDTPSKVIAGIEQTVVRRVAEARALFESVDQLVQGALHVQRRQAEQLYAAIDHGAHREIAAQRQRSTELLAELKLGAVYALSGASDRVQRFMADIGSLAQRQVHQARRDVPALMTEAATRSRHMVAEARAQSQALVREIAGQGPEKTLTRGFALVRDAKGHAVTSATVTVTTVDIQFHDGQRAATLKART